VSAGYLQPKGRLMVQADWLGPEVGGHLAWWAAFISPCPCNDSRVVLWHVRNCRSYYYY